MEYKRYTKGKIDLDKLSDKAKSKISDTYLEYAKMNNALWELENKIENGTLIELPCKVDSIVYFVSKKNGIQWSDITEIQVLIDRYTKFIQVRDDEYKWHRVDNKSVFLTKAEANQELKRLNGEQK